MGGGSNGFSNPIGAATDSPIASGPIGGWLGTRGGYMGTGINAPQGAAITNYITPDQINTAYGQTQQGLTQQQGLITALQGQGNNPFDQQAQLANALQMQSMGQGPNPAQAMLNQQTGMNTSNQAALMAGQRGAGANAGLIARQSGMQGAMNQQNAIGQGAVLQAQQQLGAQQQLAGINQAQIQNQMGVIGGYNQLAQGQQQNLLNAGNAYSNASVANQGNVNTNNTNLARQTMGGQQQLLGGVMNGASSLMSMGGGGGGMAYGGMVDPDPNELPSAQAPNEDPIQPPQQQKSSGGGGMGSLIGLAALANKGGQAGFFKSNKKLDQVPEQDRMVLPSHLQGMADIYHNGHVFKKKPMVAARGAMVPGKAVVKGDSPKNDKVPALLSAGEIVIPRSVVNSSDPVSGAAKFVEGILAKNGKGKEHGDFKSALSDAIKSRRKK